MIKLKHFFNSYDKNNLDLSSVFRLMESKTILALQRKYFNEHNIPYAYLDGSTKDRQGQVEQFQTENKINTFLISLKAGGLGLNLTNADYVFILDPWWNPAAEEQATARAHRMGQENTVMNYKLITAGTVEEKILELQNQKKNLADEILSADVGVVKELTPDLIERLFGGVTTSSF